MVDLLLNSLLAMLLQNRPSLLEGLHVQIGRTAAAQIVATAGHTAAATGGVLGAGRDAMDNTRGAAMHLPAITVTRVSGDAASDTYTVWSGRPMTLIAWTCMPVTQAMH
jgi:hypothetical protein